jgi:hypothetical protein
MTTKAAGLSLAAWLLVLAPVAAQQPEEADDNQVKARAENRAEMYENVEILRRLLNERLWAVYAASHQQAASALMKQNCAACHGGLDLASTRNATHNAADRRGQWEFGGQDPHRLGNNAWLTGQNEAPVWPEAEGTYLEGRGVLYTVTLSARAEQVKNTSSKQTTRPPSDWERMRRQVRGEKPTAASKGRPEGGPNLADVILKVLADNGHHFARLKDNESLSVVVTFRKNRPPDWLNRHLAGDFNQPSPPRRLTQQGWQQDSFDGNNPNKQFGRTDGKTPAQDYEFLGDLQMKQGQMAEALANFQKALEVKPDARVAILYRKIAQALLAQGKDAEAQQALDKALKAGKRSASESKGTKPQRLVALPSKLIVSVPKKLLNQYKAGSVRFDELKKGATVDYVSFGGSAPQK